MEYLQQAVFFWCQSTEKVSLATVATHSISLLHEVLPADVSHDASGQSVTHHVHHCAESISVGGGGWGEQRHK